MAKRIIYTDHAFKRLRERRVGKDEVEYVLQEPSIRHPGKNPGVEIVTRDMIAGSQMTLVIKETRSKILIITMYWKGT